MPNYFIYIYIYIYIYMICKGWLVGVWGISALAGYFMPNPVYTYICRYAYVDPAFIYIF